MQASQSNNASDLLKSGLNADPKPDAIFPRTFPSPFAAPIQAARRYIERQKDDGRQSGRESGLRGRDFIEPADSQASGQPAARVAESLNREVRDESSRERDRRLERSLYEGHSIEAGLDFEGVPGNDAGRVAHVERASLADGDGSEPLFRYATPGASPDPEVIRGAISRLARGSESGRDVRPILSPDFSKAGYTAETDPAAVKAASALNFGEVARRVWEASVAQTLAPGASEGEPEDAAAAPALVEANPAEDRNGMERTEPDGLDPLHAVLAAASAVQAAAGVAICDVEAKSALAHDACNLLSALALYSELLGSPGVLEAPYLHYADELKLLAVRSKILVDRLLRSGDATFVGQAPGAGIADQIGSNNLLGQDRKANTASSALSPQPIQPIASDDNVAEREVTLRPEWVALSDPYIALPDMDEPADTAKASCPEAEVGPEETDLAGLLMRWCSLLSTMTHGTLEVVLGPDSSTPVPLGAEALERILVNLVRNARTATLEGGAIRIAVGAEQARTISRPGKEEPARQTVNERRERQTVGVEAAPTIVLTVDDSGCGMTESQVRRILGDEVWSADAGLQRPISGEELGKEQQPGSATFSGQHGPRRGLGLQIVRELVAASGGTLSIQSFPGRGTRIEVRWPVPALHGLRAAAAAAQPQYAKVAVQAAPPVTHAFPAVAAVAAHTSPFAASAGTEEVELPSGRVGPDGFSEGELRAMMLRLHRSGPPERSPLSRRLNNRPTGTREADRGYGVAGSPLYGIPSYGVLRNDPAQQETATKGAIAC